MNGRPSNAPHGSASSGHGNDKVAGTRKRRPFKRLYRATGVRGDDVYSLAEIRKLFDVEEQTVYNWVREGLKRVPGTKRFLVSGHALKSFHANRNEKAKRPLRLDQFLCLRCHMPREPAPGSLIGADPDMPALRIEARCAVCGAAMFRPWSKTVSEALEASVTRHSRRTSDRAEEPSQAAGGPENLRCPDTRCDSARRADSIAPENSAQTPERRRHTRGRDQLALPLEFSDQKENLR